MWVKPSSSKRGGVVIGRCPPVPKSANGEGGDSRAFFIRPALSSLTRHYCSFTGIPTGAAPDHLSPPTRASSAQSRTLFDINTRPTAGSTTLTSAESCCGGCIRGIRGSCTVSPAILRVANPSISTSYVTYSHDQIHLRSKQSASSNRSYIQ